MGSEHLPCPTNLEAAQTHPGGNPGANLKSISHICHPILVACVWELTEETIHLPLVASRAACPTNLGAACQAMTRVPTQDPWRSEPLVMPSSSLILLKLELSDKTIYEP